MEGNQNCCSGSKVNALLLNGWILPTVGVHREGSAPAACAAGLFLNVLIPKLKTKALDCKLNKPAAQAAGADTSRCNSTNRQNLLLH